MDEAGKGASDWQRVDRLTDAEIDAAIAADPDTWAPDEAELTAAARRSARYVIANDRQGRFRWTLVAADGEILAQSAKDFASEADARSAARSLRRAVIEAHSKAA